MSVLKVIEVLANSTTSWEDAARQAVSNASETLHDIRSVYIKDHSAIVEGGKIVEYRITAKVTFEIKHKEPGKKS
jgi:flavin-binding protein dodecin